MTGAGTKRTKALAADDLLKDLELREQTGALVEPFAFTAHARKELAQWLPGSVVDWLQEFVESVRGIERDQDGEPSLGQSRAVLERIAVLSEALGTALSMAPSIAAAELDLIGHQRFGNWRKARLLSEEVSVLGKAVRERLESLPSQSRRSSHVFLVRGIAEAAQMAGLKLSESPTSKFYLLCTSVFEALNIPQDPRGSIRAHFATQKSQKAP